MSDLASGRMNDARVGGGGLPIRQKLSFNTPEWAEKHTYTGAGNGNNGVIVDIHVVGTRDTETPGHRLSNGWEYSVVRSGSR